MKQCAEFVGALHDLGVAGSGQDSEPAVGEEIEHLGGVVEAHEVPLTDHEERGGGDRADLVGRPTGELVHDRLQTFEEREEARRIGRDGLVGGLPRGELLLVRQPRVILFGRRDLGVVALLSRNR